jgi:hypothetical protein
MIRFLILIASQAYIFFEGLKPFGKHLKLSIDIFIDNYQLIYLVGYPAELCLLGDYIVFAA